LNFTFCPKGWLSFTLHSSIFPQHSTSNKILKAKEIKKNQVLIRKSKNDESRAIKGYTCPT
jgi:hypothetical protein